MILMTHNSAYYGYRQKLIPKLLQLTNKYIEKKEKKNQTIDVRTGGEES